MKSTVLGALTAAEAFLAQRDQLFGADALAGVEFDHRLHRLAPLLVGDADDGAVAHRRVGPDHLLDFARVDVEAAADDHVLLAVGDVEVAVGVEVADVAGVQPAVDDRLRGLVRRLVVALHHEVAAHADLAGRARRQDGAGVVHDLDADQRIGAPDRREPLVGREPAIVEVRVRRQERDRPRRLGLAVAAHHHRPEDLDRPLELVDRHRRRAVEEILQRREVDFLVQVRGCRAAGR